MLHLLDGDLLREVKLSILPCEVISLFLRGRLQPLFLWLVLTLPIEVMQSFLAALGAARHLSHSRRPNIGDEDLLHIFEILLDLLHRRLIIAVIQLNRASRVRSWHHPLDLRLDDVEALNMPQLHLLSRVLALDLDLVLHLIEVPLQFLLVLLIAQLYLVQALAQLVAISLDLQVLRMRLVQLLRQAEGEALQDALY